MGGGQSGLREAGRERQKGGKEREKEKKEQQGNIRSPRKIKHGQFRKVE